MMPSRKGVQPPIALRFTLHSDSLWLHSNHPRRLQLLSLSDLSPRLSPVFLCKHLACSTEFIRSVFDSKLLNGKLHYPVYAFNLICFLGLSGFDWESQRPSERCGLPCQSDTVILILLYSYCWLRPHDQAVGLLGELEGADLKCKPKVVWRLPDWPGNDHRDRTRQNQSAFRGALWHCSQPTPNCRSLISCNPLVGNPLVGSSMKWSPSLSVRQLWASNSPVLTSHVKLPAYRNRNKSPKRRCLSDDLVNWKFEIQILGINFRS